MQTLKIQLSTKKWVLIYKWKYAFWLHNPWKFATLFDKSSKLNLAIIFLILKLNFCSFATSKKALPVLIKNTFCRVKVLQSCLRIICITPRLPVHVYPLTPFLEAYGAKTYRLCLVVLYLTLHFVLFPLLCFMQPKLNWVWRFSMLILFMDRANGLKIKYSEILAFYDIWKHSQGYDD